MTQNPLGAYRETRVRTASPGQIVVMLYAEAIKQCDLAVDYLHKDLKKNPQNIEAFNRSMTKTQDIITELVASLDFEAGGEIAQNLFALYMYFNRELLEANIQKAAARIHSVRTMLEELRGAWAVAAVHATGREASGDVNIAG
ncbi:MAG: flagellar export chaperone FliS [Spirochaetes bacterium]|nr:flagellar export chaperone FliS [Spirochaetota bacterium]